MNPHIESILATMASYSAAGLSAGFAATTFGGDPALFWPSLLGAVLASARTILPAFSSTSKDTPSAVALRAFISLTSGFCAAYYGTEWIFSVLTEQLRPPLAFGAVVIAAGGEFVLALITEKTQRALRAANGGKQGDAQ